MKKFLKIPLLFVIFIGFVSCENPNPSSGQLPPASQEGKNILGCLVNGEVFIAQGGFFGGVADLSISVSRDELHLGSSGYGNDTDVDGNVNINIFEDFNVYGNRTHILINDLTRSGRFRSEKGTLFTTGRDEYVGELTITKLDTVNYIIAGTFWFDAVSKDGEVVEIREGRFDIKDFCCLADPRYK